VGNMTRWITISFSRRTLQCISLVLFPLLKFDVATMKYY
jgi:hypothetical protein